MMKMNDLNISWPPTQSGSVSATKWAGVARMGGVGDNLIAASTLGPLHRQGYKVEVITQMPYSCVFENNPYIDKLSVHQENSKDFPTDGLMWQQWFASRGKEFDKFGNLSHSCESLIAQFPASTPFWWSANARRKFFGRNYLEAVHDIMEIPYEFERLFWPTEEEVQQAQATKKEIGPRFIAWCISGSRLDKIYPYSPTTIGRIIKELNIPVVLLGAPGKNVDMAQAVSENVRRQNGSLDGLHIAISPDGEKPTWPIRRILTLAQQCDLMISPDTGPAWAVAFESIPKIIMLSHASPENITKHWINTTTLHADPKRVPCWPCHRLHDVIDTCTPNKEGNGAACITDISVPLIIDHAAKLLEI